MRTLTWDEVWARRLAAHALRERAPAADLAGVVGRICGVQAQVMPAAEVAIGVRVDGVTRRTVQAALWEQRTLVKAFGIRGTIHLFPAEELAFWTAALRAAAEASERRRPSRLVAEQRADLRRAFAAALAGGPLTLQDLGAAVVRHAGAWAGVEDVEV